MGNGLDPSTIDAITRRLKEPAWLGDSRRQALARHHQLPWPHPSDDIWRRTDVRLLDPAQGFSTVAPPLLERMPLQHAQLERFTQPLGNEHLVVRANGAWIHEPQLPGMVVRELADAVERDPQLQQALAADGLSQAEQKLTTLNSAFHHDDVALRIPPGTSVDRPVRLVRIMSAAPQQALFPLTIITVGAGSTVILIDEYVSLVDPSQSEPTHLINGRINLVLEPHANVHYVRLQRWDPAGREFLLQRATVAEGASLTVANLALGASVSKAHFMTRLTGPNASTKLYGFVFGHGAQHVDQHTLQDHQAPHTSSDLEFRAALQDQSRMIYTGLIRIAQAAQHTEAFQANHNLLLSQRARAETIPMLEILADDVQCKHAASTSPIDEEQAFYLRSRGLSRQAAERLIVMGFVESVVQRIPYAPLQQQLREDIEGGLTH